MVTPVVARETDDPQFVELLNRLVLGLTVRSTPAKLWIIQIDNWFDHKWLRFSGIDRFGIGAYVCIHKEKVTFPPFTPNRVLAQWSFVRIGNHYSEVPQPSLPHPDTRQPSAENLQRRVQGFSNSGCFVWYSANTVANGKGSVMVYNVINDRVDCWFAGFNRQQTWKLYATKGTSKEHVEGLLNSTSEQ